MAQRALLTDGGGQLCCCNTRIRIAHWRDCQVVCSSLDRSMRPKSRNLKRLYVPWSAVPGPTKLTRTNRQKRGVCHVAEETCIRELCSLYTPHLMKFWWVFHEPNHAAAVFYYY